MSFSDLRDSSSPLFKKLKILKIKDIVDLQNCLLCHFFLNGNLPTSFETFFQRCSDIHNAPTRFSKSESLYMPRFKSVKYGLKSITNACIQSWNKTIQILESPSSLALSEVKQEMSKYYMNNARIFFKCSQNIVQILPKYYPNIAKLRSNFNFNQL